MRATCPNHLKLIGLLILIIVYLYGYSTLSEIASCVAIKQLRYERRDIVLFCMNWTRAVRKQRDCLTASGEAREEGMGGNRVEIKDEVDNASPHLIERYQSEKGVFGIPLARRRLQLRDRIYGVTIVSRPSYWQTDNGVSLFRVCVFWVLI
jgi:hypothetical protein